MQDRTSNNNNVKEAKYKACLGHGEADSLKLGLYFKNVPSVLGWKAPISFAMSVRPSVRFSDCPHLSTRLLLEWVPWNLILVTIMKIYECWNFNSGNYLFTTDTK